MEKQAVTMIVWDRKDPLEAVSNELYERISGVTGCSREQGGDPFTVFVDGEEKSHRADFTFYRQPPKSPGRLIDRIKAALTAQPYVLEPLRRAFRWTMSIHSGPLLVAMSREPLPSLAAEGYALYVRIENCPELEGLIEEVCVAHREHFSGGIFIYSERQTVLPELDRQREETSATAS